MSDELKVGDEVEWNTSNGKTRGKVVQKLASGTDIKGHHVAANDDHPEFLVESDESGAQAAHRPESLRKIKKGG